MNHPKIMIVEDERLVARDIQSYLEELGFSITAIASSASLAIKFALRDHPDLILMDVRLRGDIDGIGAAKIIRKNQNVPILFLTAFADKEIMTRAREAGSFGLLVKPFVRQQLQAMIEIAFQKHQADLERDRLDERIRHAETLSYLQMLAGGVAHGFNNHMHSILGNLAAAIKQLPDDSPGLDYLDTVRESAKSAAAWSNKLLVLSGTHQLELKELDLTELVRELSNLIEAVISANCSINYQLSDDLPHVVADPDQIQQIILILVANASEAMGGEEGAITIRTSLDACDSEFLSEFHMGYDLQPGQYISLDVMDTGCGMEQAEAENLFDPFFSSNDLRPGLGLAMVRGIVRAHHGGALFASRPGEGTVVSILLPVSKLEGVTSVSGDKEETKQRKRGAVLVADNDEMVLAVNTEMVEELGYPVFTASDGQDALEVLRQHPLDIAIILLDLTMPHVQGEMIIEKFQSIQPDIKIILTSGYDERKALVRFGVKRPHGFIQKPFQISRLEELFQKIII